MWHSEVQLSFISNHNGEAEFHLYLTDQGNISNLLSITLWDFKWRRTEEKPNRLSHLHFLSNVGRKPWNSTACKQEGRESGIWFPSCFLCPGLSTGWGHMTPQRSSQSYYSMISSPEVSTKNPGKSNTPDYSGHPHKGAFLISSPVLSDTVCRWLGNPRGFVQLPQTRLAWPQPVSGLKKKMLKQIRKNFSKTPVNPSARSTGQQAHGVEDQGCFELKLIRFCQRAPVSLTSMSVPALPCSLHLEAWRFFIFSISST